MRNMDRVNNILNNKEFQAAMENNRIAEINRIYCSHGLNHLLDVARIAYIMVQESNPSYEMDVVYATGLLHDIGKFMQYNGLLPHNESSAIIAPAILKEAGYTKDEIAIIIDAILTHRNYEKEDNSLNNILYKADKLSRNCFACSANDSCKWPEGKKNRGIQV